MRVGLFYKHYDANGGFPRDWQRFAAELGEIGENVVVYTYSDKAECVRVGNVTVRRFAGLKRASFRLPGDFETAISSNDDGLDVLELVGAYFPEHCTIARLATKHGLPYVVCPLGHLAPKIVARHPIKKRLYIQALLSPALRDAAALHVFSEQESSWVARYVQRPEIRTALGSFVEDVPEHLDSDLLRRNLGQHAGWPLILYLGRFDIEGKGLGALIEAFVLIRDRVAGARLIMIGPGDSERDALERRVRRLALSDRIFLLPAIGAPDKFSAIASADLFVYPSHYDVFPRSVREALAVGCPVLTSEETHVGPLLRRYGAGAAAPVDPTSLAEAMITLFEDAGALHAMRDKAKRAAHEALDWREQAVRLRDGYQRVLAQRVAA
jgi:glycosyltransferase involved in cell wall biosynthesis